MTTEMEEIRQQIRDLQTRVEEKEHDLVVIQQELNMLRAKLEDAIAKKHVEDLKQEEEARLKAKAQAEAEQARIAAEKAEEEAQKARVEAEEQTISEAQEVEDEVVDTENAVNQKSQEPASEIEITQVDEAQHEAIMRTIEEMSRSIGITNSESPEAKYEAKPTLGDKVSKQKLHDIKRGIGINERFLFANELFGGDMSAFSRAVEELNHVDSENDANRLLNENLATKYRWDDEDETVLAFKSLVSRRFVG